jgi:CotS family spore coat protein
MDLSRYRDKAYLITYELTTDIFDAFDLKVDDIVPIRSVYMLYTDKGIKILKKVSYGPGELEFINSVINHVRGKGYDHIVSFMNTADGRYFIDRYDGIYVVLNLVEGREADYKNPIDVALVSKALCSFHKSTSGMGNIIDKRNNLYKWIPLFCKKCSDLLKFKEVAELHEIKSDFDSIYLEYVDLYYSEARRAVELLESSDYARLCDKAEREKNICHHDLAYHNIIIDSENNVFFVDFDYIIQDLRIHDIANFMVKAIKYCNWDADKARSIIENYSSMDELKGDELKVLYGFLTFPQDFYEISRCYYMKSKNWDEEDFLSKLKVKAGYYEDRKVFLDAFYDIAAGAH